MMWHLISFFFLNFHKYSLVASLYCHNQRLLPTPGRFNNTYMNYKRKVDVAARVSVGSIDRKAAVIGR